MQRSQQETVVTARYLASRPTNPDTEAHTKAHEPDITATACAVANRQTTTNLLLGTTARNIRRSTTRPYHVKCCSSNRPLPTTAPQRRLPTLSSSKPAAPGASSAGWYSPASTKLRRQHNSRARHTTNDTTPAEACHGPSAPQCKALHLDSCRASRARRTLYRLVQPS